VTLTEFLHPLRRSSKPQQVQGVLFYLRHYDDRDAASVRAIRAALVRAGIPRARNANIAQALVRSVPRVHQVDGGWALTATGERAIRELLDLPDGSGVETDVSDLRDLARGIRNEATRGYIEEAFDCLSVGARRATVVFLWSGVVATIRDAVWTHGAKTIEETLKRHYPKAKFRKKDDFSTVKDADLLQLAEDLGVYDKSEKKQLGFALGLRNDCGHPVKYRPGEKKVSSFIEDVVGIVFS
jgi:hypothetical protein